MFSTLPHHMGLQVADSSEYIALSNTLCDLIPVMELMKEIAKKGFAILDNAHYVYCKAFEDNVDALELARLPKLRPHTKHIIVCCHHFHEHV